MTSQFWGMLVLSKIEKVLYAATSSNAVSLSREPVFHTTHTTSRSLSGAVGEDARLSYRNLQLSKQHLGARSPRRLVFRTLSLDDGKVNPPFCSFGCERLDAAALSSKAHETALELKDGTARQSLGHRKAGSSSALFRNPRACLRARG